MSSRLSKSRQAKGWPEGWSIIGGDVVDFEATLDFDRIILGRRDMAISTFLDEATDAAHKAQEKVIGTLPVESVIHDLPPGAKFIVAHPTEPMKVITLDGELVPLPLVAMRIETDAD